VQNPKAGEGARALHVSVREDVELYIQFMFVLKNLCSVSLIMSHETLMARETLMEPIGPGRNVPVSIIFA